MMYFGVTSDMSASYPFKECSWSASVGYLILITPRIPSFWIIEVSEINNR
jgi:hypothetical protein